MVKQQKRRGVLRHADCGGDLKRDADGMGIYTCETCGGVVDVGHIGDGLPTKLVFQRGFGDRPHAA